MTEETSSEHKMRVYCVIAHPEPYKRSFTHAVYDMAIRTLKKNGHEVMTTDLYESDFTQLPSLDDFDSTEQKTTIANETRQGHQKEEILRCQSRVEWCTHLLLFTPLYWLSPSAALMGWWEKVFCEGWAYAPGQTFEKGYMSSKKAMVVVVAGQEQSFYGKEKIHVSVEELMFNLTFRCFAFCGFTPLRTQTFFGLQTANLEKRLDMLNAWSEHVAKLEDRPSIEYDYSLPLGGAGQSTSHTDGKLSNHKILAAAGDYVLMKPKDPFAFN